MVSETQRPFWLGRIRAAWQRRRLVWLNGVRRVGKTTLTRMFPEAVYLNCDLPSVCQRLADPELFYDSLPENSLVVFDEVHRLEDPSLLLKIGVDAFPQHRLLATGSSTLAATAKFRDSLTGRKESVYLPPVIWPECRDAFGINDLDKRLLHGGLPEPLLSEHKAPSYFAEWMDSFFARDVQELFSIRNRTGFMKLLQLLARNSGGLVEYTNLARLSDMTRPTVKSHLEAMVVADAAFVLPPYHGGGRREVTRRPKCYLFDTGFVTFVRGWDSIRDEDRGLLWEHLVLDVLRTAFLDRDLYFWRDKSAREIDFVVSRGRDVVDTVECKINPERVNPTALQAFRAAYPAGDNYVVTPSVSEPYVRRIGQCTATVCSPRRFIDA